MTGVLDGLRYDADLERYDADLKTADEWSHAGSRVGQLAVRAERRMVVNGVNTVLGQGDDRT